MKIPFKVSVSSVFARIAGMSERRSANPSRGADTMYAVHGLVPTLRLKDGKGLIENYIAEAISLPGGGKISRKADGPIKFSYRVIGDSSLLSKKDRTEPGKEPSANAEKFKTKLVWLGADGNDQIIGVEAGTVCIRILDTEAKGTITLDEPA